MPEEVPYKFVEVEWLDANSGSGWEKENDLPKAAKAYTRGWLISETIDEVVLAGTWSPPNAHGDKPEFNQTIAIPMGMVTALTDLGA